MHVRFRYKNGAVRANVVSLRQKVLCRYTRVSCLYITCANSLHTVRLLRGCTANPQEFVAKAHTRTVTSLRYFYNFRRFKTKQVPRETSMASLQRFTKYEVQLVKSVDGFGRFIHFHNCIYISIVISHYAFFWVPFGVSTSLFSSIEGGYQ